MKTLSILVVSLPILTSCTTLCTSTIIPECDPMPKHKGYIVQLKEK